MCIETTEPPIDAEFEPVIRGYLPAPVPSLVITKSNIPRSPGCYRVEYGDRYEDELSREEVLGIVAVLLYGNSNIPYLRTHQGHNEYVGWLKRSRVPSGPVVHCPRCTRADFGTQTYHAPPACGP